MCIEKKPVNKGKKYSDCGIVLMIILSTNSYWDWILSADEEIQGNKDK
jgi:hypothetical protein